MGLECGMHGSQRNAHRILVVKHEGKVQLGSLMHRCEDNTKMDVGEQG